MSRFERRLDISSGDGACGAALAVSEMAGVGVFEFRRLCARRRCAATVMLSGLAMIVSACARSTPSHERVKAEYHPASRPFDRGTGSSAISRLSDDRQRIPKGGGTYKIGSPYKIAGRWYVPTQDTGYDRVGLGSWYGADFHGRKTANGEIFDMHALTAAHPTLPIPSYAYVTNLSNNRTILVRINDRGPYVHDRIIDLSKRSARELGYDLQGVSRVRVRFAGPAPLDGNDRHEQRYLAGQTSRPGLAALGLQQQPTSYAPRR